MTKKVLICGGRDYNDPAGFGMLDELHAEHQFSVVIHGAAKGADRLAGQWAKKRNLPVQEYPANWNRDGKRAGFLRNQRMLDQGKPDLVIAFPGGVGTADMVRISQKAGVPVIQL